VRLQHDPKDKEMTRQAIFESATEFSNWLRQLEKPLDSSCISNHNLDYIWHNYRQNWLILVEEKRHGGGQTFAQRDTHSILDQMLSYASGCAVTNARGQKISIEYRGYYLVVFDKTTPDDSGWIEINGQMSNKSELLELLKTGRYNPPVGIPGFIERRISRNGNGYKPAQAPAVRTPKP
jgi:hypothetical protein